MDHARDAAGAPLERVLPPGQHWRAEPDVMHYGPVPRPRPDRWSFTVGGATVDGVEHVFDWETMARLEVREVVADMHCATRWSALDQRWAGPRASDVIELAPPAPHVRELLVFAEFGYAANVAVDDLLSPRTVLATHLDGEPLPRDRGAPMRLIVPHLYTWKGPKWVRGWNYLTDESMHLGFWEQRGYHRRGDAWRQERYAYQEVSPRPVPQDL
ncbi:molybdopterin-dependent oxidoreductase [Ruania halotolerans]|uniref:molybdopterin-dependent oxidoreductase n=1 Tax=Ruania halotolerans TaxID=2897773 RepID=UPI001E58C8A1|nr:molybdopterin-dependent oxidoreductase [Ruania halotolerans]UFU04823.1 molybdopterin-dependent oxidoreductase [Ruania halotolerans]